jgi:GrpB-like predicted nucleotidyltransferase (UPF0157 family)
VGETAVRGEHVGSAAAPGLAAKPVVDLLLAVDALERRALGYVVLISPPSIR